MADRFFSYAALKRTHLRGSNLFIQTHRSAEKPSREGSFSGSDQFFVIFIHLENQNLPSLRLNLTTNIKEPRFWLFHSNLTL